jgi:hypothetical protein
MLRQALLPFLLLIFLGDWTRPVAADGPKLKIEVVGLDGKPVKGGRIFFSRYGENKVIKAPVAGELIWVNVIDCDICTGQTLIKVPKTGTATVVVKTGTPMIYYGGHATNARNAAEAGDLDTYNAEALQAREAIDQEKAKLAEERKLVEQWKEENYLPDMTAKEAEAAIESAKAQGYKDTSPSVRLLTRYKTYLNELEESEAAIKHHEDDFKTLQPPAKRTSMAPGTCPNGEGGLLAGWINDLTGSNLAAACNIDATRDKNKNRGGQQGGRDHHEHD